MNNKYRAYIYIFLLIFTTGCEKKPPTIPFNGKNAFSEVKNFLIYSPRDAGSINGRKAANHIHSRLKSNDIKSHLDYFIDDTPEGKKQMVNIIGKIPGKYDEWIILGSHFDTMPGIENFTGANDSGSSTGILIELGKVLKSSKLTYGIILAFFDGEEGIRGYIKNDGLHGSRHYCKKIKSSGFSKKCKAMILLDMVGDKDLNYTIPVNSSSYLKSKLKKSSEKLGLTDIVQFSTKLFIIDDHIPFMKIGIPSINLIDFEYGSKPQLNNYWHTSNDNIKNINAESLEITGRLTLELLNQIGCFE